MSASEKLKALASLPETMTGIYIVETEHQRILDALPQIVAVVEGAEKLELGKMFFEDARSSEDRDKSWKLAAALAALDEALSQ